MNVLLVLLLAACGGGSENQPAEPPAARAKAKAPKPGPKGKPVEIKGTLDFLDEGGAVLRPCGGGDPVKLKVGSGDPARVREELGADVDDVYVEMRGHEQPDGAVVIRAFDVAIAGGFDGCAQPLDVTLLARGTTPAWSASVKDETVAFEAEGLSAVTFTGLTRKGRGLTWMARVDDRELKLTLKRGRCKDEARHAFFPWIATVETGGVTYTGCAWGEMPKVPAAPAEEAAPGEEPAAGE